jgi:drug/metabolite transporter (DMT)-like permease
VTGRAAGPSLVIAGVAVSWGAIGLFVKKVDLNAAAIVSWRVGLAAATIGIALAVLGRAAELRVPRAHWPGVALLAALLAAHWWLFFETMKLATVTVAVLFAYLAPVLLALLAPRLLQEPVTVRTLLALASAVVGMALVVGGADERPGPAAIVCGVGAAVTYAFLIVVVKTMRRHVEAAPLAFWEYAGVTALLLPLGLASGGIAPASPGALGALVVLGVVLTGGCGFLYVRALHAVPAQTVGVLGYLEPVSAALLAAAVLGEELGVRTVVGGVLVLGAGLVVILRPPVAAATAEGRVAVQT